MRDAGVVWRGVVWCDWMLVWCDAGAVWQERMGGVANQFALTECLAFLISLPVMLATEGHKWAEFTSALATNRNLQVGIFVSGLSFYLYNEVCDELRSWPLMV